MSEMESQAEYRVPRKRTETRRRLLEAARALLLERGLSGVSVEAVTEAAGYTRGAFYSNFASMDDLVLALYEAHATELVDRLRESGTRVGRSVGLGLEEAIRQIIVELPFDTAWFSIRAGFAAQAAHDPELALQYLEHETRLQRRLEPMLVDAIQGAGRTLTVEPIVFTRALIAAHDGALANSFGDPDPDGIRVVVCTAVAMGLTTASTGAGMPGHPDA